MQKVDTSRSRNKTNLIGKYEVTDVVKAVIVALTTLFFCLSMTTFDDSRAWFKQVFDFITAACILYGVTANLIKHRKIDVRVLVLTVLYFIVRLISYSLNGASVTFGGAIMLLAFYLIGINKYLYGSKLMKKVAIGIFIFFDVGILLLNYYNLYFRPEYVEKAMEKYALKGMLAETNMFQSKNYAGMIAGAAIVICCAEVLNRKFEKKTTALLSPVILLNLVMLYVHSHCRSGQTGVIMMAIIAVIIMAAKRLDSTRRIVGASLIVCFLTLIPLYGLVYWHDNEKYLSNVTSVEQKIDDVSSYRYAIWKSIILSQEGHLLFGYGSNTIAAEKKTEYIEKFDQSRVTESYKLAATHKRQHNGYLAQLNESGITGVIFLLLLLLARIRKFKGRFRDGQWEKILLIYIFWLNLFEAKLVLANFFTGFLMMVLLMPNEEEHSKQSEKAV